MKVLVTGGYGFIGRHLVNSLIQCGYEVSTLDIRTRLLHTNDTIPNSKHYVVDITNREQVDNCFNEVKPDIVYHLASKVSVRQSVIDPHDDFNVNVFGSLNIILSCLKYNVKRLLFSSSGGTVYGSVLLPSEERDVLNPESPYGISKQTVENLIKFYCSENLDNVPTYTILRFANVYGPYQDAGGDCGVISIFIEKMMKNKDIHIFGTGEQVRDYIYVQDVVDASIRALENGENEIFNIGTGKETTLLKLNKVISKSLNYTKEPIFLPPKTGELFYNCLDITKAKSRLKLKNLFDLETGLKFTLDFYRTLNLDSTFDIIKR